MGEITTPSHQQADNQLADYDPYSDAVYLSADNVYLDTVNNVNANQWNVTVLVGSNPIVFKVDTGAEVTALTEETFRYFPSQYRNFINHHTPCGEPTGHLLM